MSTKLYNAFRLPTRSFTRILRDVSALREIARAQALEVIKSYVLKEALGAFDLACLDTAEKSSNVDYLCAAFSKTMDELENAKKSLYRSPLIDTSLTICFFPRKSDTLGLYFAENPGIAKLVQTLPGWQDFSYWDNTDRPGDVTSAQWAARRSAWNKALPGAGVPAESGFSVTVLSMDSWYLSDAWDGLDKAFDLNAPVGCYEDRVREHAVSLTVDEAMRREASSAAAEEGHALEARVPSMAKVARLFRTAKEQPEYPHALQKVQARLRRDVLVRDLRGAS